MSDKELKLAVFALEKYKSDVINNGLTCFPMSVNGWLDSMLEGIGLEFSEKEIKLIIDEYVRINKDEKEFVV